ncbi:MAG: replicative DNA helicase [Chloroflexota bacterium]
MAQDKLPPHDTAAEEAVNGSLLIDGGAINEIAASLSPKDFFNEPNRLVYDACLKLYQRGEALNQITVAQELDRQGKLTTIGGASYLSHLIATVPTSLDIQHYARIVYRLSVMRNLIAAASQIADIGYAAAPDTTDSLDRAEDVLFRLRQERDYQDFTHIKTILDKYLESTVATSEAPAQPGVIPYARSGFSRLDEFLGGLQRSDLIIVAGRPSMGKTSFALSVARNAAVNQKACVALFSLEMAKEPLVQRMLASEANVDFGRIRLGQHTPEEERRIMEATGILSESDIYIDDSPTLRTFELRSKARRLQFERRLDLIIVDYLQLMAGDTRTDNRVQEISYISRSLKAIARELKVPLIAVSQLSRAVEWRASHKPQLADLRESGSIEQDADIVLFIYRDDYYYKTREEWEAEFPDKPYPEGIATIMVSKHRNGPTGEIDLRFVRQTARFEDIRVSSEPSLL